MSKHILFVEDEATQRDLFESAVTDWNAKNIETGRAFTFDMADTVETAQSALDRLRCDAAMFDLRVKGDDGGRAQPKGNELALYALRQRGVPVAIISANTGEIEEEVRSAGSVGIFDKTDDQEGGNYYDRALDWLGNQWDMMDVLAAARNKMEGSAAEIFLLRLWPRWKMFMDLEIADRNELEKIVTRQYVSHMADLLGLDDPDNATWHPFENYVSPALMSSRAHTGDIFRFDGVLWVVLTPQCDMATQKVENVLLAKCEPGIEGWADAVNVQRDGNASNSKLKSSTALLRKYLNQNLEASKHFLPPLPGEADPVLVSFSAIMTRPLEDLNGQLEHRVASIATPFLSNIVQRFGSYISRTGQPNIDMARL
jgi:CheY-like chemotaxis protein